MYPGPPRKHDSRVTWQSVAAGFLLIGAFVGVLVAVSHPVAAGAVFAAGVGLYALRRSSVVRLPTVDRTLRLSRREVSLCLQLRIE